MLRSKLTKARLSSSRLLIFSRRTGFSWPLMQIKSFKFKFPKQKKNWWASFNKLNLRTSRQKYFTRSHSDLRTAAPNSIQRKKCCKRKVEAAKTSVKTMKKWVKLIERSKKASRTLSLEARNNFKTLGHRRFSTMQLRNQFRIGLRMGNNKLRRVYQPNLCLLSENSIWWE